MRRSISRFFFSFSQPRFCNPLPLFSQSKLSQFSPPSRTYSRRVGRFGEGVNFFLAFAIEEVNGGKTRKFLYRYFPQISRRWQKLGKQRQKTEKVKFFTSQESQTHEKKIREKRKLRLTFALELFFQRRKLTQKHRMKISRKSVVDFTQLHRRRFEIFSSFYFIFFRVKRRFPRFINIILEPD